MKIKSRFQLAVSVFIVISIVFGVSIVLTVRDMNEALDKNKIASKMVKDVFELNILSNDYIMYHEERPKTQWQSKHESLEILLSQASEKFKGTEEHAIIEKLYQNHGILDSTFSRLVTNYEQNHTGNETDTYIELEQRLTSQLSINSQMMVTLAFRLSDECQEDVATAQERVYLYTMIAVVIMCAIMALTSFWVSRGVLKPIAQFQKGTEIIAKGDMDHEIGITTRDEIGSLSRAFDRMLARLKEITASRDELNREITERKKAERALQKAHDELEERVRERTLELTRANESLEAEMNERKRAEEEKMELEMWLRQSQKLESIGTLASGIAHEINNPLMGIISYAELINERIEEESLKEFSEGIIEEGNRVGKIVKNLLSFARQDKESHSPAYLVDIINVSLSLLGAVLRKCQIKLEMDIPDDLPKIRCRSQQIEQVIINLLTNARDALNKRYQGYHENKVIWISVKPFEKEGIEWMRTTIEDHGTGMSPELIDRIFDPFFTTKSRDEGTGLGLSVSYGIIKEHMGKLSVESEEGKFARFHIDLRVNNDWTLKGKDDV